MSDNRRTDSDLEQLGINVIRGLAMDAPEKANSGHSGTAMALAPLAHVLWTRVMHHDPSDPHWPDRDRFVLSCGHASILIYSMLYLTGYGLTLEDLKQFRQWQQPDARATPRSTSPPASRCTTGPLGQGVANGVGLGLAERWLRARFGPELVDHYTFVLCSDGDLEEGISHEAGSLAGHLGLGRLIYVYDNNHITIDGPTELAYSDDVPEPLRRLRLAHRGHRRGGQRHRCPGSGRPAGHGGGGQAVNDLAAQPHRLARARRDGHRRGPRLAARATRRSPRPRRSSGSRRTRRSGSPTRSSSSTAVRPTGASSGAQEWQTRFDAWRGDRAAWEAARRAGDCRVGEEAAHLQGGRADGHPAGRQRRHQRHRRASSPGCMAGSADLTENTGVALDGELAQETGHPGGQPDPLRDPGARHGGGDERARPARRGAADGRDLLRLQRLHAAGGPAGRAVRGPRHLLVDPRFGRAR